MTEEANVCMEILRKAAHIGSSFDCHDCPAYAACPTGTVGWNNECIFDTAADLIESMSAELEQFKRERDELLKQLRGDCGICAHRQECVENNFALDRSYNSCWQWRGVKNDGP